MFRLSFHLDTEKDEREVDVSRGRRKGKRIVNEKSGGGEERRNVEYMRVGRDRPPCTDRPSYLSGYLSNNGY